MGDLILPRDYIVYDDESKSIFNLSRHSAHHEKANVPYWKLNPYKDAPEMPIGYLSMVYIAVLAPPIFKRIMKPLVLKWNNAY